MIFALGPGFGPVWDKISAEYFMNYDHVEKQNIIFHVCTTSHLNPLYKINLLEFNQYLRPHLYLLIMGYIE